jgi:hypothetical protein
MRWRGLVVICHSVYLTRPPSRQHVIPQVPCSSPVDGEMPELAANGRFQEAENGSNQALMSHKVLGCDDLNRFCRAGSTWRLRLGNDRVVTVRATNSLVGRGLTRVTNSCCQRFKLRCSTKCMLNQLGGYRDASAFLELPDTSVNYRTANVV